MKKDRAAEDFAKGLQLVRAHPLFDRMYPAIEVVRDPGRFRKNYCPSGGWAVVIDSGEIHVHPTRRGAPEEWAYVVAHAMLHLGLGHHVKRERPTEWNVASCVSVIRIQDALKVGRVPVDLAFGPGVVPPAQAEESMYRQFCESGMPNELRSVSIAGVGVGDLWFATAGSGGPRSRHGSATRTWAELFAEALQAAVDHTIERATERSAPARLRTPGEVARTWFINHYPLLGALAATFEIVEDPVVLGKLDISIGAVHPASKRIYLNTKRLSPAETRFVMAHEMLHAALQHDARCRGRDPFFWNVACDFVINLWLVEMKLGTMPSIGGLLDFQLKGLSAEAVYDRIVNDLRRLRKCATFRGAGLVDVLDSESWRRRGEASTLDDFYRQALQQGLEYHRDQGRGYLPAGLVEEIQALSQPPIPWDVELARWMDAWFQPLERGRSFARPSRRQEATPDIPRPSWVHKYPHDSRTFGVVLDTSGSMWVKARHSGLTNIDLLGRALGAIASYCLSREVPLVRVVFCDAAPYDQGYLPAEDLAGRVRLTGQGGTVLQPAIDLLERASDFPRDAPVLIITDGQCDHLHLGREHAFLMPEAGFLPFPPRGPVFRVES